jgi:NAD(P)-dependent dehydrogenase (short-subunit alcohol dehydrogenase family)
MTGLPSFRLDGKVAVITGASKGLGRAMALAFGRSGADVVVSSRRAAACEEVAGEIRSLGRRALAVACHVGAWTDCENLVATTLSRLGRIDILVNNAGIAPVPPSLLGVTEELFYKTVDVNLKGPLRLTALAANSMSAGGTIINISSKAATSPSPSTVVYSAAKAGLNALTVAAAAEFGPRGIRVNAIVCGPFRTDSLNKAIPTSAAGEAVVSRTALRRIATPAEIVGAALYLASDASSYMTGALMALDGGAA